MLDSDIYKRIDTKTWRAQDDHKTYSLIIDASSFLNPTPYHHPIQRESTECKGTWNVSNGKPSPALFRLQIRMLQNQMSNIILWTKSRPSHQSHKISLQSAEQGSIEPYSVSTASNTRSRATARIYIPTRSSSGLNYKPTHQGDSRTFIQGCYQLLFLDFTRMINELHWKKKRKKEKDIR